MRTLLVTALILCSCAVYGQTKKIVDVIQNEVVDMLGASIVQPGKINRGAVSLIHFPNNTAYIIYTVQVYKANEEIVKVPSLAAAVTEAMAGNVPVSKALAKAKLPVTKLPVDVYLYPTTIEVQQFLNYSPKPLDDYKKYAKRNCTDCRVMAEWPLPNCTHAFAAIKNLSKTENVRAVVNVAAVVIE